MKKILGMIIMITLVSGCRQEEEKPVNNIVPQDSLAAEPISEVNNFYRTEPRSRYLAEFDSNVFYLAGGNEMRALAWQGPMKISLDSSTYVVEGIAEVVNFEIDEECGDKYYRFRLPLDTLAAFLKPLDYGDGFYFSWSKVFDQTGKSFVSEELVHRGKRNEVVGELSDFNLNYGNHGLDSVEIQSFFARDVFDKKITIETWIVNNSLQPVNEVFIDMTIYEYATSIAENPIDSSKYQQLNLLHQPLKARSMQVIRKSINNKYFKPSAGYELKYYDTKQVFRSYQSKTGTVAINEEI